MTAMVLELPVLLVMSDSANADVIDKGVTCLKGELSSPDRNMTIGAELVLMGGTGIFSNGCAVQLGIEQLLLFRDCLAVAVRPLWHRLLEHAHDTVLGRFKMVCPKILADDLIEKLLAILLGYEQPCDAAKSLEVVVGHSMGEWHLELALGWIEMVWPQRRFVDVLIGSTLKPDKLGIGQQCKIIASLVVAV